MLKLKRKTVGIFAVTLSLGWLKMNCSLPFQISFNLKLNLCIEFKHIHFENQAL